MYKGRSHFGSRQFFLSLQLNAFLPFLCITMPPWCLAAQRLSDLAGKCPPARIPQPHQPKTAGKGKGKDGGQRQRQYKANGVMVAGKKFGNGASTFVPLPCPHARQSSAGSDATKAMIKCKDCYKTLMRIELNTMSTMAWRYVCRRDKTLREVLETLLVHTMDGKVDPISEGHLSSSESNAD